MQKGDFRPPRQIDAVNRLGDRVRLPQGDGDEVGRPLRDFPGPGRGRRALDGRRAGVRLARAVLAAGSTVGAAEPHRGDDGGRGRAGGAGRHGDCAHRAGPREPRPAQRNARTLRERDLAQQNFDLARGAVDDYITRIGQNPLLKEQSLHALRQELSEAALGYYRDFLRQRSDDPTLKAEAAAAQERVGDILIELGRPGDALAAYDGALALIEPLIRDRPDDPKLATAQFRLEAGRLQALRDDGQHPAAIAASERAIRIGEALLAARLGTDDLPEILARTYNSARGRPAVDERPYRRGPAGRAAGPMCSPSTPPATARATLRQRVPCSGCRDRRPICSS